MLYFTFCFILLSSYFFFFFFYSFCVCFFFFKQKTAYEMRISDWSSDVCSSDLSTTPVVLIGVAGVASAGKTTFLATLYCLLKHGYKIGNYQFSGSLTLTGWENIAWYLSWNTHNDIQFPPHTSSNAGRIPGLLHISLRNEKGEKKEMIFTDAPGEWFGDR